MTQTEALEVVDCPLFGAAPTWQAMDDDRTFHEIAATLGDPATVDERVVAMPAAPSAVVVGELDTRPLRVVAS